MTTKPIVFEGYECLRCSHKWVPIGEGPPKVCPKCKSPYWNTPRRIEKAVRDA